MAIASAEPNIAQDKNTADLSTTRQREKATLGPQFERGYWSAIYVREGDGKIRLLTLIEQPPPTTTEIND